MFDISWSKLLVIAVVALIVIGPKELPAMLHALGRTIAKLRRSADDFRRQFEDSMRDAGYQDLTKNLHDFKQLNPVNQLRSGIERAMQAETVATPPTPLVSPSSLDVDPTHPPVEAFRPDAQSGALAASDATVTATPSAVQTAETAIDPITAPSTDQRATPGVQHSEVTVPVTNGLDTSKQVIHNPATPPVV